VSTAQDDPQAPNNETLDEVSPAAEAPQGARPIIGLLAGLGVILIALGVSLFGVFGAGQAGPTPTPAPVVAAAETASPAAPPTQAPVPPTEAPVPPTVVPSPTQAQAAATSPPATAVVDVVPATLAWRDDVVFNDAVIVAVSGLPAPEDGTVYAAWLAGADTSLFLGPLPAVQDEPATLTYRSPVHENLLALYDRAFITRVPSADAGIEVVNAVQAGALPGEALVHIRHLLVGITSTPNGAGFAIGLRQESDEVARHAGFLKAAFDAGNLQLVRLHAEHLVNMIEGTQGEHFGDGDGDGKVKNPGDGFGILPGEAQPGYATGMTDHARLAAATADATDAVRLHAEHVQIAGENVRGWAGEIRDRALRVLAAPGIAEAQEDVLEISTVAQRLVQGVDLNLNEQIEPVPGEGGVLTAYQHAQLMAGLSLDADVSTVAAAPQPGPPAILQPVRISIGDLVFQPSKITVPAGATVLWENPSGEAHTVTADEAVFDRPRLEPGETFEQQLTQPGVYPYFCSLHGDRGGEGMAGTIIVAGAQP
jgi:plastocyanin